MKQWGIDIWLDRLIALALKVLLRTELAVLACSGDVYPSACNRILPYRFTRRASIVAGPAFHRS